MQTVEVDSVAQLRAWLRRHHRQSGSIWLVTYKKVAGARYLPYAQIVEQALCFGWIDSQPRSLDGLRSMRRLSPRRPGSSWSKANKERVARLIASGAMTKAGLAKVTAAKRDGSWHAIDRVQALVVPSDLDRALRRVAGAKRNFNAFPPSSQRVILEWIAAAKRPETRAKRIAETAQQAGQNERANHYRRANRPADRRAT